MPYPQEFPRGSRDPAWQQGDNDWIDCGFSAQVIEDRAPITLPRKTGWRQVEIERESGDQTRPTHALTQTLYFARGDFGPICVALSPNVLKAAGAPLSERYLTHLIKRTVEEAGPAPGTRQSRTGAALLWPLPARGPSQQRRSS